MNIHVEHGAIAGVPALTARPVMGGEHCPVVFWLHGFGADKEVHRPELERIAGNGFIAIGLDAVGHGERRLPDLAELQAAPRAQAHRTAVSLAVATAKELPGVVRELTSSGRIAAGSPVAAVGISMGGYALYRAIVEEPRIRVAVALLGSPEWPYPDSPHDALDAFAGTALLSITGEYDENVPPAHARALHERLTAERPDAVQRYMELEGGVHLMSEAHWHQAMAATLEWLERHRRILNAI
jgi:uncharacterized protein